MRFEIFIATGIFLAGTVLSAAEIEVFYPLGDAGIFPAGQNPEFKIKITDKAQESNGVLAVKDYSGKTIQTQKVTLKTNSLQNIKLDIPKQNGFYTVESAFGGNPVESSFLSTPLIEKRDPFFATVPCDWSAPEIFRAYKTLGFGAIQVLAGHSSVWFTDNFNIDEARDKMLKSAYFTRVSEMLETNKDFEYYGKIGIDTYFIDDCKSKGRQIPKIITDRRDQGFYCYPKEYYDCFMLHIETFQKMAGSKIKYWALVQEVDSAILDKNRVSHGGPVELAHHLVSAKLGYNVLKKFDPDCRVSLMSSCGRDYHITKPEFFITKFLLNNLDGKFDIIGLDAYNGNYSLRDGRTRIEPPENGLRSHIMDAKKLSREFGKDGTVTVEERSFHMPEPDKKTPLNGKISRMVADFTARETIIIKSVSHVPYYAYLDYAYKSDQVFWKAVLDENKKFVRAPFPSAIAYATTARMLAFAKPDSKSEIRLPYSVYGYLFRQNDKTILPLWQANEKNDSVKYEIDLPCDCVITDINGNDSRLPKGKTVLTLTGTPFFMTISMKPEDVREFIEKGKFVNMQKVKGEIRFTNDGKANLFLANQLGEAVEVNYEAGKLSLKPYEKRVFSIPVPTKKDNSITVGDESYPVHFSSDFIVLRKMAGNVKIDGNIEKYKNLKPVLLTSPKDVYPQEATIPERALLLNDGKDIEVNLYLSWNAENLYVSAKVRDRAHMNNQKAGNIWQGDSVQIGIIPENTAWNPDLSGKKDIPFNISAALTDNGIVIYDHIKNKVQTWDCSIARNGLYTTYELAIPWRDIGIDKPRKDISFAMALAFFDLNTPGAKVQHWAGFGAGLAGEQNPSKFKTLILGE